MTELATSGDTADIRVRTAFGIPGTSAGYITPISYTPMCNTAGELINTFDTLPAGTPHVVYLVQIGGVFWAEDTTMRRGSRGVAFTMNGPLTSVITRIFD